VSDEDVIAGAVRWLRAHPAATAHLGVDAFGDPLIVQDQPPPRADFAQQAVLVLSNLGVEGGGNDHNTFQQIRLQTEYWVDPVRDDGGNLTAPSDARQRMTAAYSAVDRLLHRPQGGAQQWGAITTTDCIRRAGLAPYQVPGSDGLWRGTAIYAVGLA
jgi:hypothetical protein